MSDSPDTRPSLAGRRFAGRYELEQRLAAGTSAGTDGGANAGTFGDTYRAKHVEDGRVVVVKVLHDDLRGDALRTSRFEWEAATLAGLSHPNTPPVLDFGVFEGRRYVVRQWLEGENLAQRLERGPLPLEAALSIGRQLLAALGSAHAAKLLHRNIRPSNVFLERRKHGRERVKLLDFAPANPYAESGQARPSSPNYELPEHRAGVALDAQSDVYAVGKLMAEMLADPPAAAPSAPPPAASAATAEASAAGARPKPPAQPAAPRVPPGSGLERWLTRATAEPKLQRFSDAGHMLRELIDILPRNLRAQADDQPPARPRVPLPFTPARVEPAKEPEPGFEPASEPTLPLVPAPPTSSPLAPTAAFKRTTTSLPEASPVAVEGHGEPGTTQLTAATAIAAFVVAAVVIFVLPSEHGQASRDALRRARHAAAQATRPSTETKAPPVVKPPAPAPIPLSATRLPDEVGASAGAAAAAEPPAPAIPPPLPAAKSTDARNPWLEGVPEELKGIPEIADSGVPGDDSVLRKLRIYNELRPNDPRGLLLLARMYLNRSWRSDGVAQFAAALQRDRSARGAPEILPALLNVIAEGRAASDAEALIERIYGSDAIPAIDRALETVATPIAVSRLSTLSARLITRPPSGHPSLPQSAPVREPERPAPKRN